MATEEQAAYNSSITLSLNSRNRVGQRLTIPNRTVSKLSFSLFKVVSPTGNVTFAIRKVSDDSVVASKVWGDASALPTEAAWKEVTFDDPVLIDEEVRIMVEWTASMLEDFLRVSFQNTDVKGGEFMTDYVSSYLDRETYDCAYIYTYVPPAVVGRSFGFIFG